MKRRLGSWYWRVVYDLHGKTMIQLMPRLVYLSTLLLLVYVRYYNREKYYDERKRGRGPLVRNKRDIQAISKDWQEKIREKIEGLYGKVLDDFGFYYYDGGKDFSGSFAIFVGDEEYLITISTLGTDKPGMLRVSYGKRGTKSALFSRVYETETDWI